MQCAGVYVLLSCMCVGAWICTCVQASFCMHASSVMSNVLCSGAMLQVEIRISWQAASQKQQLTIRSDIDDPIVTFHHILVMSKQNRMAWCMFIVYVGVLAFAFTLACVTHREERDTWCYICLSLWSQTHVCKDTQIYTHQLHPHLPRPCQHKLCNNVI